MDCSFCQRLASGDVTEADAHAAAFADGYPVAAGHTLVVPRRHVASVFDLAGAGCRPSGQHAGSGGTAEASSSGCRTDRAALLSSCEGEYVSLFSLQKGE
jgi:hypothetical protein